MPRVGLHGLYQALSNTSNFSVGFLVSFFFFFFGCNIKFRLFYLNTELIFSFFLNLRFDLRGYGGNGGGVGVRTVDLLGNQRWTRRH